MFFFTLEESKNFNSDSYLVDDFYLLSGVFFVGDFYISDDNYIKLTVFL